jgi:hypothetical protein
MRTPINTRDLLKPVPGFYRLRLVKGGMPAPVRVELVGEFCPETGEPMEDIETVVTVDGVKQPFERIDRLIESINIGGQPVTEAEYNYRLDVGQWAKAYAPDDPAADPRSAIDLNRMKPIF